MESYEKVQALQAHEHALTVTKNQFCKNGEYSLKPKKNDNEKRIYIWEIKNKGCKNLRRNGSAFCQACSDKYKKSL